MADYDLLVIGCGPGGQRAAIAAAKLGRRAAVIEKRDVVGGVCVNTGTIPSKSLREAVLYLTGLSQRDLYGQSYRVKEDITMNDLTRRTHHVVAREIEVVRDQLASRPARVRLDRRAWPLTTSMFSTLTVSSAWARYLAHWW